MLAATNISENTQFAKFAKYNSKPKFVDLQYVLWQLYIYMLCALSFTTGTHAPRLEMDAAIMAIV